MKGEDFITLSLAEQQALLYGMTTKEEEELEACLQALKDGSSRTVKMKIELFFAAQFSRKTKNILKRMKRSSSGRQQESNNREDDCSKDCGGVHGRKTTAQAAPEL